MTKGQRGTRAKGKGTQVQRGTRTREKCKGGIKARGCKEAQRKRGTGHNGKGHKGR